MEAVDVGDFGFVHSTEYLVEVVDCEDLFLIAGRLAHSCLSDNLQASQD